MSDPRPGSTPGSPANEPEHDTPTYQGSRFPWWLTIFYLAFLIWGLTYASLYFLPDLRAWLSR